MVPDRASHILKRLERHPLWRFGRYALPIGLVALVAFALAGNPNSLFFEIVAASVLGAAAIDALFPQTRLLPATFASLVAVYASIFALFLEGFFAEINRISLGIGFAIPILLFVLGCWYRRVEIRALVRRPPRQGGQILIGSLAWLLPVCLVGAGVYLVETSEKAISAEALFFGAMSLTGLIVFSVSREIVWFLVDVGLLFDEFARRISRLAIPAFAFLTFYALLVIVFGALYSLISQHSVAAHFRVGLVERPLTFLEAMYFSIVTISTVGYGDIVPASNLVRVLASAEVVFGVLLLLFGVSELLEYTREHRAEKHRDSHRHRPD